MLALEDLVDLGNELRNADFRITTHQYLFAQQMLVRLAAEGRLPNDPSRLASHLGPIFCTTPYEQRRYPEIFQRWLARRLPDGARTAPRAEPQAKRSLRSQHGRRLALGALTLAVAVAVWFGWQNWRPRLLSGAVVVDGGAVAEAEITLGEQKAVSDASGRFQIPSRASRFPTTITVRKAGFEDHQMRVGESLAGYGRTRLLFAWLSPDVTLPSLHLNRSATPPTTRAPVTPAPPTGWRRVRWTNALIATGPALLLVIWVLVRAWRRPILRRIVSAAPKTLRDVYLSGDVRPLLPNLPIRRLTQDLRRRRRVHSTEIDVSATIGASIANTGLFTPVFGSRVEPDYLVLTDRESLSDHQACLADALVGELLRSDVLIQRYDYDGDPTVCRRPREGPLRLGSERLAVPLDELRARHPEHRVIVFSDGAEFFHPFTGEPASWVTTLTEWTERVILTPKPIETWAHREWALGQLGFVTLPLSRAGLIALGPSLNELGAAAITAARPTTMTRSLLDMNPRRWLERDAPPPETIDQLCQTLLEHLGARGFVWLAACAVYPEIHWGITLRLVSGLARDAVEVERLLPRLSHLVWFREAYMPDWLREALLSRLSSGDEARVRALLHAMLSHIAEEGNLNAPLRIALGRPQNAAGSASLLARLGAVWRRWQMARRTRAVAQIVPQDSPFRDYIFLHFLSARRIGRLTPVAPKWLLRALYRGGNAFLGLRPWVNVVSAALATAAILALLPPLHIPAPLVDRSPRESTDQPPPPAPESPVTQGVVPRPPLPAGFDAVQPVGFGPIFFEGDKSDVQPGDTKILDQIADWMRSNPDRRGFIAGHAAEEAGAAPTAALGIGERRAKSVMDYLVGKGIAPSRFTMTSYGAAFPACTENSESCRAQNRRVDILVSSAMPPESDVRSATLPVEPPRPTEVPRLVVSGQGTASSSSTGQPTISLALGAVAVGKRGSVRQITIVNEGQAAVDLEATQRAPESVTVVRDECGGAHLEPKMSCRAAFQLSPQTVGPINFEQTYAPRGSDDPRHSVRVAMRGQALAPERPLSTPPPVEQAPAVQPPPLVEQPPRAQPAPRAQPSQPRVQPAPPEGTQPREQPSQPRVQPAPPVEQPPAAPPPRTAPRRPMPFPPVF